MAPTLTVCCAAACCPTPNVNSVADTTASAPARLNIPFPPKSRFDRSQPLGRLSLPAPFGGEYGTQQPGRSTSPAGTSRHLPFARPSPNRRPVSWLVRLLELYSDQPIGG